MRRLTVLPLVCRRFADVLRSPGPCWRELDYREENVEEGGGAADSGVRLLQFLQWAAPRAAALRKLVVDVKHDPNPGERALACPPPHKHPTGALAAVRICHQW